LPLIVFVLVMSAEVEGLEVWRVVAVYRPAAVGDNGLLPFRRSLIHRSARLR